MKNVFQKKNLIAVLFVFSLAACGNSAGTDTEKGLLDEKEMKGWPPLHVAAYKGDEKALEVLLTAALRTDIMNILVRIPIEVRKSQESGNQQHKETIKSELGTFVIEEPKFEQAINRVETDFVEIDGATSLILACLAGNGAIVRRLLQSGVDVVASDKMGMTPLHAAAVAGYRDIVELLIAKGAKPEAKNKTCVIELTVSRKPRGSEAGMYDSREFKISECTPLHLAAVRGHVAIVEFLLRKGADIEAKDSDGWTAMEFAKWKKHEQVVKTLRKYGAKE